MIVVVYRTGWHGQASSIRASHLCDTQQNSLAGCCLRCVPVLWLQPFGEKQTIIPIPILSLVAKKVPPCDHHSITLVHYTLSSTSLLSGIFFISFRRTSRSLPKNQQSHSTVPAPLSSRCTIALDESDTNPRLHELEYPPSWLLSRVCCSARIAQGTSMGPLRSSPRRLGWISHGLRRIHV